MTLKRKVNLYTTTTDNCLLKLETELMVWYIWISDLMTDSVGFNFMLHPNECDVFQQWIK